jgi:Siphovirus ReqiPepy6 Gp37-like protein
MNFARQWVTLAEYILNPDYTWNQAVILVNDHIGNLTYPNDNFTNIVATSSVSGTGIYEARSMKRDDLHKALLEILAIEDLGVRIIRRSIHNFPSGNNINTQINVHKGVDKTSSVIFSWKAGEIGSADYLWSDKTDKNPAMVVGRSYNVVVDTSGVTKYNRRSMLVDGSDIDDNFVPSTEQALAALLDKMRVRGRAALLAQNRTTITRADLTDVSKYRYRTDFNVGDLITLDGNFGQIAFMRVTEYVEIQDETGESGHPTLALPGV